MNSPRLNLLDEPLIRIRDPDGALQRLSLSELFAQLSRDAVRDYPALRPHQRHPWHALLVQLAALALHQADETVPWDNAADWRAALLALTPNHPDGCAFSLIAPHDRPAFLQAPVPGAGLDGWNEIVTPDALDMLVTSRNHDLKGKRMRQAEADDWLFALCALQTDGMYSKAGPRFYYGSSRVKGCFSSRPATGISPPGRNGARWKRDVAVMLDARGELVEEHDLTDNNGLSLLWLAPWDGKGSIAFDRLDPFYIEVCRRVRLRAAEGRLAALSISSDATRIAAASRNGNVGDAWAPVERDDVQALGITERGFHYKLISELLAGEKFRQPRALRIRRDDATAGLHMLAQGVGRGKNGVTAGYHERYVPLTKKTIGMMRAGQSDRLALIANARVQAVATMCKSALWPALVFLIDAGRRREKVRDAPDAAKAEASNICKQFESLEDERFFDDLNREIEANDAKAERLAWLIGLADRAEDALRNAFTLGPQCGESRYRARARALSAFHAALRNEKHSDLLQLVQHRRSQTAVEEAAL